MLILDQRHLPAVHFAQIDPHMTGKSLRWLIGLVVVLLQSVEYLQLHPER
jgi:hypothetical protein